MEVTPLQNDVDARPLLNASAEIPAQSPSQSTSDNTNNSTSNNSQNNDANPFLSTNSVISSVPQKDLIDWLDALPSNNTANAQPTVIFDPFSEIDKLIIGNEDSLPPKNQNSPASPKPSSHQQHNAQNANNNNSPSNNNTQNNNTPKKSKILITEESEAEIQNILEIQKQEALKYLAQQQANANKPKPVQQSPPQNSNNNKNMVPCPICSKKFPEEQIESHVNICLDGGAPESEAQQPVPKKNEAPLKKSSEIATELASVEAQIKILEELHKRKEQEEADRLLAEKLMNELHEPPKPKSPVVSNNNANNSPVKQPSSNNVKLSDEELAILLMRQDEEEYKRKQKEKEEADKKLAEFLNQKEKQEEEERLKKVEWEDTLNLIKQQAKQEADAQLARLLREKEELQAQLQELSFNSVDEKNVALSLAEVETPSYWQHQVSNHQMFDVKAGSEEYKKVLAAFRQGMPSAKVARIERNQNKTLWTWYFLQRQVVAARNNDDPNEKKLFHGSRNDAYETILKEGFDHRVANLGGAIGAGIYFGVSSGTSAGYVVQSSWKNTNKKMLYCRVTLGSVGQGQGGLRRPPEKSKGKLHDSVGDHHTMYVVFDNHQAYPEYVIHFQ